MTLVYEVTPWVDLHFGHVGIAVPIGGLRSSEPRVDAGDATLATSLEFHSSTEGVYYWDGPMKSQQTYSFYLTLEPTAGGSRVVYAGIRETGVVDSMSREIIDAGQSMTLSLYSPSLAR